MIQDISPKIFNNEYCPKEPKNEDLVFAFEEGKILAVVREDGHIEFPTAGQISEKTDIDVLGQKAEPVLRYLFCIDEKSYYLYFGKEVPDAADILVQEGDAYKLHSLRILRRTYPREDCFAAMTAWHLYVWYRDNLYCGRCGQKTEHDSKERMLRCPECGNQIYPRISPAVIVGVTDGDRIMMTRYAGREHKGNALIAGFCEIGETAEETVRREVMEEVGLHVKNIRYYKSQPWGFAGDLLMGFYCEVDGSRSVHMDEEELASARWVCRDEIGDEPADVSLTADMIMHFKNEISRKGEKSDSLPDHIRGIWYGHRPGIPERKGTSAVVIPLVKKDGEYHILFEQRASNLVHQPGEYCFPGGRVETGESPREAAIRETAEELLINPDQIEILAELDAQMGPTGAPIWPFAALLHDYRGTYSDAEVGKVFTIPLSWFKTYKPRRSVAELMTVPDEDFPYELIPGGKNYPFRRKKQEMIFYETPEAAIWGVTARITADFLKHL